MGIGWGCRRKWGAFYVHPGAVADENIVLWKHMPHYMRVWHIGMLVLLIHSNHRFDPFYVIVSGVHARGWGTHKTKKGIIH